MKKFILLLFVCISTLCLTSCITEAYAETGIYDDDIEIVIRYGTPYYYGNTIAYYYYDGYYFYPYRYNNAWRFHRYARPLPPPRHFSHYGEARPHHPHNNGRHTRPNGHNNHGNGHHVTPPSNPPRGNGNAHGVRPSNPPRMNNGGHMSPSRSGGQMGGGARPHSGFGRR